MNHCDVDTKVVLYIAACSSKPTDSLFDKSLHASHDEKQTNHLDVQGNDSVVI